MLCVLVLLFRGLARWREEEPLAGACWSKSTQVLAKYLEIALLTHCQQPHIKHWGHILKVGWTADMALDTACSHTTLPWDDLLLKGAFRPRPKRENEKIVHCCNKRFAAGRPPPPQQKHSAQVLVNPYTNTCAELLLKGEQFGGKQTRIVHLLYFFTWEKFELRMISTGGLHGIAVCRPTQFTVWVRGWCLWVTNINTSPT